MIGRIDFESCYAARAPAASVLACRPLQRKSAGSTPRKESMAVRSRTADSV